MSIQVDAAIGDAWEELGRVITASGGEDSSGYRRYLAKLLYEQKIGRVANLLNITAEEAEGLRATLARDFGW